MLTDRSFAASTALWRSHMDTTSWTDRKDGMTVVDVLTMVRLRARAPLPSDRTMSIVVMGPFEYNRYCYELFFPGVVVGLSEDHHLTVRGPPAVCEWILYDIQQRLAASGYPIAWEEETWTVFSRRRLDLQN